MPRHQPLLERKSFTPESTDMPAPEMSAMRRALRMSDAARRMGWSLRSIVFLPPAWFMMVFDRTAGSSCRRCGKVDDPSFLFQSAVGDQDFADVKQFDGQIQGNGAPMREGGQKNKRRNRQEGRAAVRPHADLRIAAGPQNGQEWPAAR
jgi:hypothetical protein